MGFFAWLKSIRKPKKLKLGLALGAGGAKGFAHLGALKAFEENGIEFDVIAGTSIGSIVGAAYADGYSSTDIFGFLKTVGVGDVKEILSGGKEFNGLYGVIERILGGKNIQELKKPFMAVATELDTGNEYVFKNGSVSVALVASSAIPPYFKPVFIDGVRYVDGAYSNSIPADLAREMGADYVVGIDLRTQESKKGILSKIFPSYQGKVEKPWQKGYDNADVMLHPDLSGYDSISFLKGNEMYDIGYITAIARIPQIKQDLEYFHKKKKQKNKR